MPLLLLYPAIAGVIGFGAGFFTSGGVAKLGRLVIISGVVYVVYNQVSKK